MKLIVKDYDLEAVILRVIIHEDDCMEIGVKEGDRVRIDGTKSYVVTANKSDTLVKRGEILMPKNVMKKVGAKDGMEVNVVYSPSPESVRSIRKKMDNQKLTKDEINAVIDDILEARLSLIETSAWLTSLYINGMDVDEIADMTMAMVNTGDTIQFDRTPVFDFHSIGGALEAILVAEIDTGLGVRFVVRHAQREGVGGEIEHLDALTDTRRQHGLCARIAFVVYR